MAFDMSNGAMNIISGRPMAMGIFSLPAAAAMAMVLIYALPALAQEPNGGPLAGFTVVDASDQTELATLTDSGSVELADADGGSYGIRADIAEGETVGSVRLELTGAKSVGPRTENLAPYSLYGDHRSGATRHLDGESLPVGSYTITATAYSERQLGGDELGTLEVSFTVSRANSAPEFGSATYSFSIADDAATGAAVGSVSATDADDDGLTYSIETGNGEGKFAMDGSSGAITTAGALDHETTASYALTVQADDGNGGTATATVNVSVTDVDESTTGPLTGFMLVDASDQTELATLTAGASVELSDPDGGSYGVRADLTDGETVGSVRLELSGAKAVSRTENVAPYSLYGDGGAGVLEGQSLPAGSYTVTATAYGERNLGGNELGTLEVSFTVSRANHAPEFGSATYSFSIADDATTGAAVGTVAATDADDDSLTYSIETGNGEGKFAIDGSSGAITTAGALDHETTASYALTVQAEDGNGGTATATVNIAVTDAAVAKQSTLSDDTSLSTLSLTGITLSPSFADEVTQYNYTLTETQMTNGLTTTVSATPGDPDATVDITPGDGDGDTPGHQVVRPEGRSPSTITIEVMSPDGTRTKTYSVSLGTYVHLASFESPGGLWSDGTTLWVSHQSSQPKLLAYDLSTFERDAGNDFTQLPFADSDNSYGCKVPRGIWSDGTTMWILDTQYATLIAYDMETKTRDSEKDIFDGNLYGLHIDDNSGQGLWSDGNTIWVVNFNGTVEYSSSESRYYTVNRKSKLLGYNLLTKRRSGSNEFHASLLASAGNHYASGIWSDGTTMWVADVQDRKLYAYNLSTQRRDSDKDIDLDVSNSSPVGSWSDGITMWVLDDNKKLYGYHLPPGYLAAPMPTLNPAVNLVSSITHASATLTWDVPEQPEGVSIEGLYLEYVRLGNPRIESELVSSDLDGSLPRSWTQEVSNLSPNSTYRWRVSLRTNRGTIRSEIQSLRTKSPPKPPEGLSGFLDSGDVVLTWTVPEQPDWVQVERIEVSRDPGMDTGEGQLSLQDGATLYQYTDDDVEASTEYEYEIHMVTGTGTYRSDVVTLTTGAADQAQLAAPTDLQVANGHGFTMLSWSAPSGVSLRGYQVLRREEGVDAAGEFRILVPNTGSTETGYTDEGAEPETTYEYKVRGIDGANLTAASGWVTITTPFTAFPDAKELDLESRTLGEWHSYQDEMIVSNREIAPVRVPIYYFILSDEYHVSFEARTNGWPGQNFRGVTFDVRDVQGNVLFNSEHNHPHHTRTAQLLRATLSAGTYYLVPWVDEGQAYRITKWPFTVLHRLESE